MPDNSRRKEMLAAARLTPPEAGVYRILNKRNGKVLVGSSPNLVGIRSRFEFAQATNSPGALDHSLRADADQFGLDALTFEVVDTLTIRAEMTAAQVSADLAALEALWRENEVPEHLY